MEPAKKRTVQEVNDDWTEKQRLRDENAALKAQLAAAAEIACGLQRGFVARIRGLLQWHHGAPGPQAKLLRIAMEMEALEQSLDDGRRELLTTISVHIPSLGAKIGESERNGRRAWHGETPDAARKSGAGKATETEPWPGSFLASAMGDITQFNGETRTVCLGQSPDAVPLRLARESHGQLSFLEDESPTSSPVVGKEALVFPAAGSKPKPPPGPALPQSNGGFGTETAGGFGPTSENPAVSAALRLQSQFSESEALAPNLQSESVLNASSADPISRREKPGGFGTETAGSRAETAVEGRRGPETGAETAAQHQTRRRPAAETAGELWDLIGDRDFPRWAIRLVEKSIEASSLDPRELDPLLDCLRARIDQSGREIGSPGAFARTSLADVARRTLRRWNADGPPPCEELAKLAGIARAPRRKPK